jgi:hypothetical protein
MTARALAIVALAPLLQPEVAAACATCLTTAYGDRTYNLAFLGLLLMPFVVASVIGGILLVRYRPVRRSKPSPLASPRVEETT